MSAKIHNIEDHADKNNYKKLITRCHTVINDELSKILTTIFDDADDLLFNTAEHADSSNQQTLFFDVMRSVRLEKQTIIENFINSVNEKLTAVNIKEKDSTNTNELSLVSQDEMEEMVAISSISNQSDTLHTEQLSHLQARIEHYNLKTKSLINKDTLLPKNICADFLSAMSHLDLDTQSKLIFLKVFGRHIDIALNEIYNTINYRFIEIGILPTIKAAASNNRNSARTTTAPNNEDENANQHFYDFANTHYQQPNYNHGNSDNSQIQNFINNYIQRSINDNAVTKINDQNFYDRRHVVKALSQLQTKSQNPSQPLDFNNIKQSLLANINSGTGGLVSKQVNHSDEKTIEVVELLFKEIIQDSNITTGIQSLILRLQIPTIKVAMLDPQFFNNQNHPARNLLNTLSHVGIGITEDSDELLSKIEPVIDTLLNDYEQDSVSFQKALDSLNRLFNQDFETCQKKEQHTQKQILREHARKIVLAELQILAKQKYISKANEPLVLKLWPTHMYHQYINFGKDSPQWNESVSALKLIIDSLQPPKNQKQLQQLISRQDEIAELIEEKLRTSNQDKEVINQAIYCLSESFLDLINHADILDPEDNDFSTFLLETFTGSFSQIQEIDQPIIEAHNDEELLPPIEEIEQPIPDKRDQLLLLPKDVKPGLWFELYDGDDKPCRRLKLSVIIMEEAQLIFVNRQGVKIMEKNAAVFADELNDEVSKIIADHSVFDQALNHVISELSKTA